MVPSLTDIVARLDRLELRLETLERNQAVISASLGLARWLGPILIGVGAIMVSLLT